MISARAITKYVRISPRKVRRAADLIRGLQVDAASLQLASSQTRGGLLLQKTLKSAVANAEQQENSDRSKLKVQEVRIDAGPTMKRAKSKSRGGRVPVLKRSSHFTIIVAEAK